jgi:hypothetical protein
MVTLQVRETLEEARVRLAAKARLDGVTLTVEEDGRHYASSTSKLGQSHYVTGYSCDCAGFANRGRCRHHSALLSAMGWIDDADHEPPRPGPTVAVVHVPGHWSTGGWLISTRDIEWTSPTTTIAISDIDVVRISGDDYDVRAHWLEDGHAADNMTASMPSGLTHRGAAEHWLRALAASASVDSLLFNAGIPEDRDLWDDMPDVADVADNSLEEVA